ncbi:unnamed protein product [Sphagnum troendelagicum]
MEEVRLLHMRRKYSGQGSRHTITASSSSYATPAPYQQLAGSLQEVTDSYGDHVMWGVSPRSKKRLTVPELHHPCSVKPKIIGPDFAHNTWVISPPSKYSAVNKCGGDLWSFRRQKAASWIKLSDLNWQDHQVKLMEKHLHKGSRRLLQFNQEHSKYTQQRVESLEERSENHNHDLPELVDLITRGLMGAVIDQTKLKAELSKTLHGLVRDVMAASHEPGATSTQGTQLNNKMLRKWSTLKGSKVTDHPQRECEEGRNIEAQTNCETEDWPRQQDFSWCLSNQAVTERSDIEFGEINLQRDHPQNEKMPGDVKQQPSSIWSLQLQHKILEGDWIPPPHSAVIIEELSSCTSKQERSNNIKQSEEGEWILPHIAVVIEELSPCTSKQEGRDSKQCGGFLAIKELVESSKVEEEQHHKEACHKENVQLVDCASEAVLRTADSTNLRSQGDDGVTKSGKTCARDSLQSQEESFHLAQTCTTHQNMDTATGDSLCSDGCTQRDTVSADPIGEQMPDTEDVTLMMKTQKMLKDGLHTHERSHQRQESGRSPTDEHTRVGTSRVASRIKVDGEGLQADKTQEEKLNAAALKIQARYREYLRHRLLRLEDRWKQLLQRFTYSPKNEATVQESIAGINYQSAQVPSGKVAHKQKHVTWRGKHTAGGASTDMKPQAAKSQIIPTNGWHYISLLMPRHLHHHHQRQKEWRSQAQTIHNDAQEKFVPYPQTKGSSSHICSQHCIRVPKGLPPNQLMLAVIAEIKKGLLHVENVADALEHNLANSALVQH